MTSAERELIEAGLADAEDPDRLSQHVSPSYRRLCLAARAVNNERRPLSPEEIFEKEVRQVVNDMKTSLEGTHKRIQRTLFTLDQTRLFKDLK